MINFLWMLNRTLLSILLFFIASLSSALADDEFEAAKILAEQGHLQAEELIVLLKNRMSPEQLTEAERLAQKFVPKSVE